MTSTLPSPGDDWWAEAEALLLLSEHPRIGIRSVHRLRETFGSARGALDAPLSGFARVARLEPAMVCRGGSGLARARDGLRRAHALGMGVVPVGHALYPPSLHHLADPPPLLFVRGRAETWRRIGVAVVGSRKATPQGRDTAFRLGRALGAADIPVVSGLALGIDGAAHRGALEAGGPTVAVLGCGLDRSYPAEHARLQRSIGATGLLVSEFLPGTRSLPHHFPRRNRIIAALARAVIVVEAGARSGALHTVSHALDLGVDVYAVPGSIGSRQSRGTNALLRDGARVVVSVEEVLDELGVTPDSPAEHAAGSLPADAREVLLALSERPLSVDELAVRVGMEPSRILGLLSLLEMEGWASKEPGLRFRRAS